jgi:hypothetical protein
MTHAFGSDFETPEMSDQSDQQPALRPRGLTTGTGAQAVASWAVGVTIGRFDIRLATGDRSWPKDPGPFEPLPDCAPAELTGEDGLPCVVPPEGYPITPSTILVEDTGHPWDVTTSVREVVDIVFAEEADRWWTDLGVALDPKSGDIGLWLRRVFFEYHLGTYSRSRRRAPMVWPIGTASGSYKIWLYGHRVTNDTLFQILSDLVRPKLELEILRLSQLATDLPRSPSAAQRRALEEQRTFVDELTEFRDELRAVSPLWVYEPTDGCMVTLAPMWRLFVHSRSWAAELRSTWMRLCEGEYDWSRIAMHIWPERVVPKCAEDRSFAIAHDLEEILWSRDGRDQWHPRQDPVIPIEELIAARASVAVVAARTHPTP